MLVQFNFNQWSSLKGTNLHTLKDLNLELTPFNMIRSSQQKLIIQFSAEGFEMAWNGQFSTSIIYHQLWKPLKSLKIERNSSNTDHSSRSAPVKSLLKNHPHSSQLLQLHPRSLTACPWKIDGWFRRSGILLGPFRKFCRKNYRSFTSSNGPTCRFSSTRTTIRIEPVRRVVAILAQDLSSDPATSTHRLKKKSAGICSPKTDSSPLKNCGFKMLQDY